MWELMGNLWNRVYLRDGNIPMVAGPGVRVTPPVTGPVPAAGEVDFFEEPTDAVASPTDSATLSSPAARDPRLGAVDVSVLTGSDQGPIPDVTPLLQSGQLAKAVAALRQALPAATPKQQYQIYFMLADIALASGDVKALNEAYDQVLKIADPEEADPIERLRRMDLEEIAARQSAAPPAVEPQRPPAVQPEPAPVQAAARDDSQPYDLENRANEHKEDVEEHASHVLSLVKMAQTPGIPLENAMILAEQAGQSYEQAFQALEKAKGTVQTLRYMLEDYPNSTRVKHSLERAEKTLKDAETAHQGAAEALNSLTTMIAEKQKELQNARPPVTNPPATTEPRPTTEKPEKPTAPPADTSHKPPVRSTTPAPVQDKPVQQPVTTTPSGPPTAEELAWAQTIYERYQKNDPALTEAEKERYNAIATRNNQYIEQQQSKPTTTPTPTDPQPVRETQNQPHHHSTPSTTKPTAPVQNPPVAEKPAPVDSKPEQPPNNASIQDAVAEHERKYEALAARVEELRQRRWAISRREMAVTALGLTNSRAQELVRQRNLLDQDRAKLAEEAQVADQSFLQKLLSLNAIQQAADLEKFIAAKARKIREAIFGQQ